jgi:hypothetical protein
MVKNQGLNLLSVVLAGLLLITVTLSQARSVDSWSNGETQVNNELSQSETALSANKPEGLNSEDANIRKVLIGLLAHYIHKKDFARAYEMEMLLEGESELGNIKDNVETQLLQAKRNGAAAKRRTFFVGK